MTNNRALLSILAAAAFGLATVGAAIAQSYPTRPIKVIVPTPAGGPVDVMARLVGNALSGTIRQSIVVDNRPGAGNTIGRKPSGRAHRDVVAVGVTQ